MIMETLPTLTYEAQTLQIATADGMISMPGMVAIGTGLGYWVGAAPDNPGCFIKGNRCKEVGGRRYYPTHIQSGHSIVADIAGWFASEKQARTMIECIASLTDWTRTAPAIFADPAYQRLIRPLVKKTYMQIDDYPALTAARLTHLNTYHGAHSHQAQEASLPPHEGVRGTVETIGYLQPDAAHFVADFLSRPQTVLLDIRYSPRSRWYPEWNKSALQMVYGKDCYQHVQAFGNINYNKPGEPIILLNPDAVLSRIVNTLQAGTSLLLLCGCKNYDQCHRKVVAELIGAAYDECLQKEGKTR